MYSALMHLYSTFMFEDEYVQDLQLSLAWCYHLE